MNRNKRPMTSRLAKQQKKAIRSVKKNAEGVYRSGKEVDALTEKELAKRYPNRKPKKTLKAKKAPQRKTGSKVSKRTTPGSVPSNSTPASVHREGKVWAKTLVKQSLNKRKTSKRK